MRRSTALIAATVLLTACSDGDPAAPGGEPAPGAADPYDRAVECAAINTAAHRFFLAIAISDEEELPGNAAGARRDARRAIEEARAFARIARRLGADDRIGKSAEQVEKDIDAADRAIGQRIPEASELSILADEIDSTRQACRRERRGLETA